MSSPPNPRQDAFISYQHDNNLPPDPEGNGWVDYFHLHLDAHLRQFAGRKVTIWRDPELAKNVILIDSLQEKISQSVALVPILSPGYVNSPWCMGELREFCALAQKSGGLHPNGKSRIFAVVKLPPSDGKYPKEIADQLRYEFFEPQGKSRWPDEFSSDPKKRDERYWLRLKNLAWDLFLLLQELGLVPKGVDEDSNILSSKPKKTIYLAETTGDLAEQRRQIKEELKLHDYNVVPDEPLPYVLDQYSEAVKKNLAQAEAAISVVGRTYGIIPEGAGDRSILRLQFDLVNEFANSRSNFKRLIWMPAGWETSDAKTGQMVKELQQLSDPQIGLEFLQTSLEEFKTLMHDRLAARTNGHKAQTSSSATTVERRKVYLVCDRRDLADVKPIMTYLRKEHGYEVEHPEFEEVEGEPSLLAVHEQKLLECDGVIVYWGHANSRWVNSKKADFERHAGLEKTEKSTRMRPLRAKLFYAAPPFDDLKDVFEPSIAPVVKNPGDFDPSLLHDFIRDLEGGDDNQGGNDK